MANNNSDFDGLGKLFDVVLDDLREIKKSLSVNTREARAARREASAAHRKADEVNGAFKNIKERLDDIQAAEPVEKASDLPIWYRDPNLMNFLKLLLVAVIIIVVAIVLFTRDINLLEALV